MNYKIWTPGEDDDEPMEFEASSEEDAVEKYFDEVITIEEAAACTDLGIVAVEHDGYVREYRPRVDMEVIVTVSLRSK